MPEGGNFQQQNDDDDLLNILIQKHIHLSSILHCNASTGLQLLTVQLVFKFNKIQLSHSTLHTSVQYCHNTYSTT